MKPATCTNCKHAKINLAPDHRLRIRCTLTQKRVSGQMAACYFWQPRHQPGPANPGTEELTADRKGAE